MSVLQNNDLKQQIKQHALQNINEEACGLIIQNGYNFQAYPCRNTALDKKHNFILHSTDYLKASQEGKISYLYHSHFNKRHIISEIDKQVSKAYSIPLVIYNVSNDDFFECSPDSVSLKYIGRKFRMGINDCLTLFIDYYKEELDIKLQNPYSCRGLNFTATSVGGFDFKKHQKLFEEAGFKKINKTKANLKNLKVHDGLIFKFFDHLPPTHIAIYLGDNYILEQSRNKDSQITYYSDILKLKTAFIIRHKSLMKKKK